MDIFVAAIGNKKYKPGRIKVHQLLKVQDALVTLRAGQWVHSLILFVLVYKGKMKLSHAQIVYVYV